MELFSLPNTGNIIAFLSLLIDIVGLFITILTMNSARKIEQKMDKLKANAITKSNLQNFRPNALSTLERTRAAVAKSDILTRRACNDMLTIIGDMQGFSDIFTVEDNRVLERCRSTINKIERCEKLTERKYVLEFLDVSNKLIMILKKGEYAL